MQAGGVISVNTIAGILGALAFGFTSDKIFNARRPPTNVIFAALEIIGLLMVFFGPSNNLAFMTVSFFIYGFGLTGLVTSLGGLFALDIAPKRAAGAAMGFIGVFSYIGAALQDQISGHLIENGVTMIDGVRHYDFTTVIWFWVGSSVLSLILATSLWRVRVRD
jgi:OPA family sugar phosphate sensor protein UhpC-like MFS transporter